MAAVKATRTFVPDEEFAESQKLFDADMCKYSSIDTSMSDIVIIENMLDLQPGELKDKGFKMMKAENNECGGCGRLLNWLDVIHTAIEGGGHTPRMLAATFRGEYGNIISAPITTLICSSCNHYNKVAKRYGCGGYHCYKYDD